MNKTKLLKRIVVSQKNVRFSELRFLMEAFGFRLDRISGSHHIYVHDNIPELINIQNIKGEAKPYQIKQFLAIVEKYNLRIGEDK